MKYIEKFEKIVACLSVSVMAILVFINVIARFVFNNPLAVADEMSCYLFVLMSFMGTAIAARRKAHLGLTLLTDKLSPNAGKNCTDSYVCNRNTVLSVDCNLWY